MLNSELYHFYVATKIRFIRSLDVALELKKQRNLQVESSFLGSLTS